MATLICNNNSNLTGPSTFATADTAAGALAMVRSSSTTFGSASSGTSNTFTVTSGAVIDAVLLWVSQAGPAGSTGTFKVDLQKGGVSQGSVTVNKTDLPDYNNTITVPTLFKLSTPATGNGASNWTLVCTTTGTHSVNYSRNTAAAGDFTRALRTTNAATPSAGDDLYIIGELTGVGTYTARTVTMDSTGTTAYGSGLVNSATVAGGGIKVSYYGTLTYGSSASTNYNLRVNGDLNVYQNGELDIGQLGTEIPTTSTATLEFQMASLSGDFGLNVYNNAVLKMAGLPRTSGKNVVACKLTSDMTTANILSSFGLAIQGSLTANVAIDPSGVSLYATGFVDNAVASTVHSSYFFGGSLTNVAQTAEAWIAKGTGTNNRYVRLAVGNNTSYSLMTNAFYVDIDLTAGTVGTPGVLGVGSVVGASIVAVGPGWLVKLTGTVSTVSSSTNVALVSCSAPGTTSYTGNTTQCFVYDHVNLVNASSIPDTTFNVTADTGWLAGDHICVAATSRSYLQCENYVLNANAGPSSLVSSLYPLGADRTMGAVTVSGTAPTQAEVGLVTRNVKLRSTSSTLYSYVYFEPLANVTITWAEFYYLGCTAGSPKHGIETKDGLIANAKSITYCSVHDSYDGIYLAVTALTTINTTFSNNVIWNISQFGVYIAGPAPPDWVMDSNLFIKPGGSGVFLGDLSGTFTNNNVAGTNGAGININSNAAIGTISGNATHSNNTYGILVNNCGKGGTINNQFIWRNSGYGIYYTSTTVVIDLVWNNLTCFGNGSANICLINFDGFSITGNSVIAGDTLFATLTGVTFYNSALGLVNMSNVDMSGSTSIFAPHTTNDLLFGAVLAPNTVKGTVSNCKFGAPSLPVPVAQKVNWSKDAYIGFQSYNQTAGDHRTEMTYGTLKTDAIIYNLAAPSMRMIPISSAYKLESAPKSHGMLVPVANGSSATVSVYVYKSAAGDGAAYTGNQPRLIQRANPALGQQTDVVLATYSAGTGAWNQLTASTSTPTDDGAFEMIVDCDGVLGWINVDDWAVS